MSFLVPEQRAQPKYRERSYYFSTLILAISRRIKSAEAMPVSEVDLQTTSNQPGRIPLPVYSMLPSALKSGLQPLALVRRSLSDNSLRSRVTSLVMFRSKSEATIVAEQDVTITSSSPADSAESICWKFARHGSNVLQTSLAESQNPDTQDQEFSRQLYLDAMAYLIQGLPPDLTDQEKLQLKSVLPDSLNDSAPYETAYSRNRNPSLLHRSVASTIITICLLLRLASPYVKLSMATAYNYDRTHHVRERAFALGVAAVDKIGKGSMALASNAMTNESVLKTVTYWTEGIRGGLDEGLDQGLRVMENQNGH